MRELNTIRDVKTALADYMRAIEIDEIDAQKGNVLIAGSSLMVKIIKEYEFEDRLKLVEEQMLARGQAALSASKTTILINNGETAKSDR